MEEFWVDDPSQLFDWQIFPREGDSKACRFNAITRLVLLITVIIYFCNQTYSLYFLLFALTMIIVSYYTTGEKEGYNYIPIDYGKSPYEDHKAIYVPRLMDEEFFGGRRRPMNARDVYAPTSVSDDVSSDQSRYMPDAEDPEMYYSTQVRNREFPSRTADRPSPWRRLEMPVEIPEGGRFAGEEVEEPLEEKRPMRRSRRAPVEGFSYGRTLLNDLPDGSETVPKYRTPIRVVEEPEDSYFEEEAPTYPDFRVPEVEHPEMTMVDVPDVPEAYYRKTTVEPGGELFVYNDSHRNLASNIGMTEIPPKMRFDRFKARDGSTIYHGTDKYIEDPTEDGEYKNVPDNSYVYDPRFSGYGDPDRVGWEPLGGQVQYWYRDTEAYTRPNFISKSNVDHIDFITPSGQLLPDYKRTADYEDIRRQVKDRSDADTLLFREDMMANLMEKMDSVDWQKRHFSLAADSFNRSSRMAPTR